MRTTLNQTLDSIRPLDMTPSKSGQARLDDLTKPQGSLGRLEELALRIHIIQRNFDNKPMSEDMPVSSLKVDPALIVTMAGDHGVAASGVSLFPQEVTRQMVLNFATGGAGVNVLARTAGADLIVADVGVAGDTFPEHENLVQRKVAPGTANLQNGPAMTEEQCLKALQVGIDIAEDAADKGYKSIGLGEMGIGNTTPSTALYCAHLGLTPEELTGRGTGLPDERVREKAAIISQGLEANKAALESKDPVAILAALGGYEIAGMAGLVLGGAKRGMLVLVDGFIATAAYTAAWKMNPNVRDYAFFSHASAEQAHVKILNALDVAPLLHLGLRLGEGTGAAMSLMLLRSAVNIFNEMATFSGAGVSRSE